MCIQSSKWIDVSDVGDWEKLFLDTILHRTIFGSLHKKGRGLDVWQRQGKEINNCK